MRCYNFFCVDHQANQKGKAKNNCFTAESCDSYGFPEKCEARKRYESLVKDHISEPSWRFAQRFRDLRDEANKRKG